jgi:hypothetical protein
MAVCIVYVITKPSYICFITTIPFLQPCTACGQY